MVSNIRKKNIKKIMNVAINSPLSLLTRTASF